MRYLLLTFLCLGIYCVSIAQFKEDWRSIPSLEDVDSLSKSPYFPGGYEAWSRYIAENVQLEPVKKYVASRRVYVEVIVTRNGELISPQVIGGCYFIENYCDQLMRAIERSPAWSPAQVNEDSVAIKMVIVHVVN
jgi:hypothetical protein